MCFVVFYKTIHLNFRPGTISFNNDLLIIEISDNPQYTTFVQEVLGLIKRYNKKYRTNEVMFNCEMIPAENVGIKHAKWDKEDGFVVPRDCYNSYFYIVD